jgi:hypothetical protein
MTGWVTALGPAGTALVLLVLGHVLGDFVFQTDELATKKRRMRPLLSHGGIVLVVHLLAFLPLLSAQTALIVGSIGFVHVLIDAVSARVRNRQPSSVRLFLGDQLVHLLVILIGWTLLDPSIWATTPVVSALGGVTQLPWSDLTIGAMYVSVFVFAHEGANTIVSGVLPDEGPDSTEEDLEVGSLIGTLERWIILLLGLAGRWESVALVVAAKSIARFEELKERAFAEYFLVGTLTSVLIAMGLVVLVSILV